MLAGMAAASLLARPVRAQVRPKMFRVGALSPSNPENAPSAKALRDRLHELGYVEGKDLTVDQVYLNGRIQDTDQAIRDLIARKPDVVVVTYEAALKAAIAAGPGIPIVNVAIDYDPIAHGYVQSLARPGGNVTGLFLQQLELAVKRLQLFKETFPELKAATLFWDALSAEQWKASQHAAPGLGFDLAGIEFTGGTPFDYDAAFARAPAEHRRALVVANSPNFFVERKRLSAFTVQNRVPAIFAWREWVDDGGLMSFGPSFMQIGRMTAEYVDKIARGAKPADLPVEQPSRLELVINQKTAHAFGLTFPRVVLARADEVIE